MRRTTARLTLLLLSVCGLLVAAPAAAGGPTSVLLSVPGESRTASLYHTDPDYQALSAMVGAHASIDAGIGAGGSSGRDRDIRAGEHQTGEMVTFTWLIHDVQVWRVDRVYLGGDDGTWVATQEMTSDGSVWDAKEVWHKADTGLPALLDRLLPTNGGAGDQQASEPVVAPEPLTPAAEAPAAAGAVAAEASATPAVVLAAWTVGGLAAGAALTLLWQRRTSSADVDERPTATDQLAWP